MKYLNQIAILASFSILLYYTKSYDFIYWVMAVLIGTTYLHPLFALISRSYRKQWDSQIDVAQMIIAASVAIFNMRVVLKDSSLCTFYGVGVGLSFIATSYLITRRA